MSSESPSRVRMREALLNCFRHEEIVDLERLRVLLWKSDYLDELTLECCKGSYFKRKLLKALHHFVVEENDEAVKRKMAEKPGVFGFFQVNSYTKPAILNPFTECLSSIIDYIANLSLEYSNIQLVITFCYMLCRNSNFCSLKFKNCHSVNILLDKCTVVEPWLSPGVHKLVMSNEWHSRAEFHRRMCLSTGVRCLSGRTLNFVFRNYTKMFRRIGYTLLRSNVLRSFYVHRDVRLNSPSRLQVLDLVRSAEGVGENDRLRVEFALLSGRYDSMMRYFIDGEHKFILHCDKNFLAQMLTSLSHYDLPDILHWRLKVLEKVCLIPN